MAVSSMLQGDASGSYIVEKLTPQFKNVARAAKGPSMMMPQENWMPIKARVDTKAATLTCALCKQQGHDIISCPTTYKRTSAIAMSTPMVSGDTAVEPKEGWMETEG